MLDRDVKERGNMVRGDPEGVAFRVCGAGVNRIGRRTKWLRDTEDVDTSSKVDWLD